MIIIHSKEDFESTTENVIDWLDFYGTAWIRINGEELMRTFLIEMELPKPILRVNGLDIKIGDVDVVWYRRGGNYKSTLPKTNDSLVFKLNKYLNSEFSALRDSLPTFFNNCIHIDHPAKILVNKIDMLKKADYFGMSIPNTIITNDLESLKLFYSKNNSEVICKSIYESSEFEIDGLFYILHTEMVKIDDIPDKFFPSLFQRKLDKDFELRVFYLDGKCHSAAIFSQADERTSVDFRNYNVSKPNRVVPYSLPSSLEQKITLFMNDIGLTNGSLDFVKIKSGEIVFLEVNPTGQFGMISKPCNYYLEKKMADFLKNCKK
jgi:ATP-GRASP peptide maturase of grasp-with-spasm system